jgi:hypothetical protein
MHVAIGRQHPIEEGVEYGSVVEAQHLGKGRSARANTRISAQPIDIGETQDKICAALVPHDGVLPAVPAKSAVSICFQFRQRERREHVTRGAIGHFLRCDFLTHRAVSAVQ